MIQNKSIIFCKNNHSKYLIKWLRIDCKLLRSLEIFIKMFIKKCFLNLILKKVRIKIHSVDNRTGIDL